MNWWADETYSNISRVKQLGLLLMVITSFEDKNHEPQTSAQIMEIESCDVPDPDVQCAALPPNFEI